MGGTLIALTMPFDGLPAWAQVLFYIAFVLIVSSRLDARALRRSRARARIARPRPTPRPPTRSSGCSSSRR